MQGLCKECLEDVRALKGVFRVYFVLDTAQLELNSGRV